MAINPINKYGAQIDSSDSSGYPYGRAQNVAIAGDGTGTPLEEAWVSDIWGFFQQLLARAGLTPSGTPDKVGASQYQDALDARFGTNENLAVQAYEAMWGAPTPYMHDPSLDSGGGDASAVTFSENGLLMHVLDASTDTVYQYICGTAFNQNSAYFDDSLATSIANGRSLVWNKTGTEFLISGNTNISSRFTASTAWDAPSATYAASGAPVWTSVLDTVVADICVSADGQYVYALGVDSGDATIARCTLSTPNNFSTAGSYVQLTDVSVETASNFATLGGIEVSGDGRRIFVSDGDDLFDYKVPVPFTGTPVYTGKKRSWAPIGAIQSCRGINFTTNGSRLTYTNGVTGLALSLYSSVVRLDV